MGRSQKKSTNNVMKSQVVSMYSPRRVPCPSDPPVVQNTVRATKSIEIVVPQVNGTSKSITVADVMAGVPGGTTYWAHVRFQSFRIWAESNLVISNISSAANTITPVLRVDCQNVGVNQPSVSWTDSGTTGQKRPGIAFQPALSLQAGWLGVASTTPLFNIRILNGNSGAEPTTFSAVTIQAVVEILSPNLS